MKLKAITLIILAACGGNSGMGSKGDSLSKGRFCSEFATELCARAISCEIGTTTEVCENSVFNSCCGDDGTCSQELELLRDLDECLSYVDLPCEDVFSEQPPFDCVAQ